MWIMPRLLSRPAARLPHVASAASIALSAASDPDLLGRDARAGGPFGALDESTCLGVLWAALLAVAAVAVATRGPTGTTPPFAIARELLAGGLAAALGEALFFPVEVVKVCLRRQHTRCHHRRQRTRLRLPHTRFCLRRQRAHTQFCPRPTAKTRNRS